MRNYISNSQVNAYLQCKRKYYYSYLCGIKIYPSMLSRAIKRGRLLDEIMNAVHAPNDGYDPDKIISEYEIGELDLAMVYGVTEAMDQLLEFDTSCAVQLGTKMHLDENTIVKMVIDRLYSDTLVETKFSGKPDNYTNVFNINPQISTYLNGDPDEFIKKIKMEVIRVPELRFKEDETFDQFRARITNDVLRRPSYYLIGYDKDTKTFGKYFYRNEFSTKEIKSRYKRIWKEIQDYSAKSSPIKYFYKQEVNCNAFKHSPCEYKSICETGGISNRIYYVEQEK